MSESLYLKAAWLTSEGDIILTAYPAVPDREFQVWEGEKFIVCLN